MLPNLDSLTLAKQVAQMVVVRASGFLFDHQIQYPVWEPTIDKLHHWIRDLGVGGVILLGGSAAEVALRNQQLQVWADVPLLIAADVEEGVGQRFNGATWFPPPLALAAIAQSTGSTTTQTPLDQAVAYAEAMGAAIAQEAQAIGLNWVLAPVVDVNNNPANPVINVRAFGESPELVSQLATAFIRGASRYPVLTAAKHFPGHGDTTVDSHLELPIILHSQERLQALEQLPFEAAIAAGVDAVMSAHLQIPALDPKFPATLSERILTGGLRQGLGFEGLIVTDALVMGAIANRYGANQAPVLAVMAGADILLMPVDPAAAIQAICDAVEAGQITPERIRASVERIWQAKHKVCASTPAANTAHAESAVAPAVDPQHLTANLAQPQIRQLAIDILSASQHVHLPTPSRLNQPHWAENCRNLVLVDAAIDCDYLQRTCPAIAFPTSLGYHLQLIDNCTPSFPFGMVDAQHWCPTLLQLFMRGNPFRGSAALTQTAQNWLQFLLQSDQIQALILYGSPYVLEQFLSDLPADVPYVFTYGQMPAAQATALRALGLAA